LRSVLKILGVLVGLAFASMAWLLWMLWPVPGERYVMRNGARGCFWIEHGVDGGSARTLDEEGFSVVFVDHEDASIRLAYLPFPANESRIRISDDIDGGRVSVDDVVVLTGSSDPLADGGPRMHLCIQSGHPL
jgi:hypothetical protein